MKNLKENISFGASIFTFISAIVGALAGLVTNCLALGIGLFSIVLLICIIVLQRKYDNIESKIESLYVLSMDRRIHTINLILYLETLQKKENKFNPKKGSKLYIQNAKFNFIVHNNKLKSKAVDVKYEHTFYFERHDGMLDTLFLHSIGSLCHEETYCEYKGEKIKPTVIKSENELMNKGNQRITHCQFDLSKQKYHPSRFRLAVSSKLQKLGKKWLCTQCEQLTVHYYNFKEYLTDGDETFVVVPQNYGQIFMGGAKFCVEYDCPVENCAIRLKKLSYGRGVKEIEPVGGFKSKDGKIFTCEVESLDIHGIYFVNIQRSNL